MSVPSRLEAAALLLALEPPDWLVRHSAGVAEVAAFLAHRASERGARLDRSVVESAALLHDLDKALPRDDPLRVKRHGEAGAAWLAQHGHGELSAAVGGHTATLLSDEERYPRWNETASAEARIVAYADKRVEQELVSLDERFASWLERHPEHAANLRLGLERARLLEQEVCALAGVEPHEVGRAAWAEDALSAASTR